MRGALQFDFFLFVMRITGSVAVGAGLTASTRADPASATLVTERPALVEEIVVFFFVDFSEVVPFFLWELFLQLTDYFLKAELGFSFPFEKLQEVVVAWDARHIDQDLAEIFVALLVVLAAAVRRHTVFALGEATAPSDGPFTATPTRVLRNIAARHQGALCVYKPLDHFFWRDARKITGVH